MRAILLIRVSTEQQDLVQQREKVIDAAKRDGFDEKDLILIEDKESAVKLSEEERNGLNRLKEHILNDSSITTVYAYEISRISRQAKIVFSIRDFLIEHRIQLVILNPYFKMLKDDGTLSETSNIFFGIFASMAENEGYIRKARMKRGKEKSKAIGRHYTGQVPIGYSVDKDKRYIINKETAPIVKKIFEMYVERGMSLRTIVTEMRERGYFNDITFHGCVRNIHEILHRDYYCGMNEHMPAIISRELYDKAQETKKRKKIELIKKYNKSLCKGVLFNKDTGYILTTNTSIGIYYSHSGGVSVMMSIIDPIVWDYVVETHREYSSQDYGSVIGQIEHDMQVLSMKYRTQQDQIENYMQQIDKLEERIILGKIRSELADKLESDINKNIHDTKAMMSKTKEKIEQLKHHQDQILNDSEKTYDYEKFDMDERISLVNKVVERVELYRKDKRLHIELHNKYNSDVKEITLIRKWRNWIIEE